MAKEDVQVIYEEADDEYWMKPLREAITLTGASVANAVVRQQHYGQQMAESAAKRAHEAYIAQMGIRSSEKVAGMKLGAEVARHKILDKQHDQTMKINKRREDRQDMIFARDNTWHQNDINATQAGQTLMASADEFMIDGEGNISTDRLKPADLAHLKRVISKSPSVANMYLPLIQNYNQRQDNIAGRLQMLKAIQATHGDGALSQLFNDVKPLLIENLKGTKADYQTEGKGGWGDLQAIARKVTNDDTWAHILKSYNIDKETLKNMPKHQYENFTKWGAMLARNSLEGASNIYKGTAVQNGIIDIYGKNLEYFQDDNFNQSADAILAAVAPEALDHSQKDRIKNTTGVLNAGVIDFMHATHGYFTNEKNIREALMKRVSRVVQLGSENIETKGNALDKKIFGLVQGDISESDKKYLVQDVLKDFIKDNNYIKLNQYKSILGKAKEDFRKNVSAWEGATPNQPLTSDAIVQTNTTPVLTHVVNPDDNIAVKVTTRDIVAASGTDNETMDRYLFQNGYKDIVDGHVITSAGRLSLEEPHIATKYFFDKELKNTEAGSKIQGTLEAKKKWAKSFQEKKITVNGEKFSLIEVYNKKALRGGRVIDLEDAYRHSFLPDDSGLDSPFKVRDVKLAMGELNRIREMYRFNRNVAVQMLLANQAEVPLFAPNGTGWLAAIEHRDNTKGGAQANLDYKTLPSLLEGLDESSGLYTSAVNTNKQLQSMLDALNMGKESNEEGDEFGVSQQLRLLAKELAATGGVPSYAHVREGLGNVDIADVDIDDRDES